jgi:nicotinic acid mononucleotide adenylyltransferase
LSREADGRVGVYPGSFNPPTVAHEAIVDAAVSALGLRRLDLAVSRVALAKEDVDRPLFEHRLAVLRDWAAGRPDLGVVVTDAQLLVDIARGYDVVVMGADKWQQIQDPAFYGSAAARDAAIAALPTVLVAPRSPHAVPAVPASEGAGHVVVLPIDTSHDDTSSSAARAGAVELMVAAAADFDRRTGAWTDPGRYEAWLQEAAN